MKNNKMLAVSSDPKYEGLVFWVDRNQSVRSRNRVTVHPYAKNRRRIAFPERLSENKLVFLTAKSAKRVIEKMRCKVIA